MMKRSVKERRDAIDEKSHDVYVYLHLICHLFIIVYRYNDNTVALF